MSSSSKYSGDKRGDRRNFSSSGGRYVPPHLRQRGGSRDDDGYDDAPLPTRTSYGKLFSQFFFQIEFVTDTYA